MTEQMFLCKDAAVEIAKLIEAEKGKIEKAAKKQARFDLSKTKKKLPKVDRDEYKTKFTAAIRDKHRAETSIRVMKECLRWILLERACTADDHPHEMPNIEEYLAEHQPQPIT